FTIADGNLKTAANFDFEARSSYTIRVQSTDSGNLATEKVFVISITEENDAPAADAGGPYTVAEGGSVPVSGTGTDPDVADTLSSAWALDNDGTFEPLGPTPPFSAVGLNGPASHTVRLRVTDAQGLSADGTATITITDVAPR